MKQTKPITIIVTIQPPDAKFKRKLTVAAAPEGQMPARTFTGTWPDLHMLVDDAWLCANTERPAHVEKPAAKPVHGKKAKSKGKVAINESEAKEVAELEADQIGPVETEAQAVEASEPEAATEEISEDQLPLIEGDD